ncbi:MAG: hypothetical protein HN736_14100, partial [Anaerolineae bacterium]|nr:hypothetical protein [Anaerolineae bacterium]
LSAQNLKAITFYAKKMKVQGDPDKQALQDAALSVLAVRSNGSQPAAVVA